MPQFASEKLLDFFHYYEPQNLKHKKAILELAKLLPVEQLSDEAPWVQIYRTPMPPVEVGDRVSVAAPESIRQTFTGVIDWNNMRSMVSQYFSVAEVTQNDTRRIPAKGSEAEANILIIAKELDKVREAWGAPLAITSWYRPEPINSWVGGVRNSQHITGGAVDIYTMDGHDQEFERLLDQRWGGGVGYGVASGRGFTHLDLREGGWEHGPGSIRWFY